MFFTVNFSPHLYSLFLLKKCNRKWNCNQRYNIEEEDIMAIMVIRTTTMIECDAVRKHRYFNLFVISMELEVVMVKVEQEKA